MHITFVKICSILQICIWLLAAKPTRAEIIPDTTLTTNSTVTPSGTIRVIEGGTRNGDNLFHSFREFSFSALTSQITGDTALFNHDLAVKNIITRVTGESPARIDGLIQTIPGSTANLFFLSPKGIIFGANASLDIGGSFIASTANSLKFADGTEFSATPDNSQLLKISVPVGLQFGNNPGEITQSSSTDTPLGLEVPSGKTLALVGNNISLQSSFLAAPGGRIELGSVADGFVSLTEIAQGYALGYSGVENFGDIQLTGGTILDASNFTTVDSSGAIQMQGRNITLDEGSLVFAIAFGSKKGENLLINATDSVKLRQNSQIATVSEDQAPAGDILVKAGNSVELADTSFIGSQVCSSLINCQSITGNGGNLLIETQRLLLQSGSGIEASTFGVGKAGNILVKATDSIDLIGETPDGQFPSGIFAQVGNDAIENPGDAGTITLETKRLTVQGGAQISTAARFGGKGGDLTIHASESILLSGASQFATASPQDTFRSGIFVSAQPGATNNVGTFNINTSQLIVEDGARIAADNFGSGNAGTQRINVKQLVIRDGGEIRSGSFAQGSGGTLIINASESVDVTGTGIIDNTVVGSILFSQAEASGKAGNLIITSDRLLVADGAEITVSSQGSGQAGNLEITARSIKLDQQGKLLGQTTSADGGNITINLKESLLLRRNSLISTSAGTAFSGGNGGTININAPFIFAVPQENSDITANAFSGQGGSVNIQANSIFGLVPQSREQLQQLLGTTDPTLLDSRRLPTNDITAISQSNPALNGIVSINTPDVDPSRGLIQLPTNLVDASKQIAQSCNPENIQRTSSLFITGRGGIPYSPTEPLTSEVVMADWITPENATSTSNAKPTAVEKTFDSPKIVEAQGWIINAHGDIILVAQSPTVNYQQPWSSFTSCHAHESSH